MLNLLSKLVKFKSIYPHEKEIGEFIFSYLKNKNLKIEKVSFGDKSKERNNLLISQKKSRFEGQKKILLYAHLDTINIVPGWKTDPFKLTVKGDKAYGLGAYDMKGGLAVILNLLLLGKDLPIKVIFGVDEENISQGIHSLKGHPFFQDIAFALVPEPNFDHGEQGVCLGRTGRLVIEVSFKGDANHIFYANSSANAIREAEIFDSQVKKITFKQNRHLGKTIIMPRAFQSQAVGLSVPGSALIEYDLLTVPPLISKEVLAKFSQLANDLVKSKKLKYKPLIKLKTRITPYLEPYEISQNNQYLSFIEAGIKKIINKKPKYYYRSSVADENVLVNVHKIPSFTLGPNGANAHQANEYVSLSSLEKVGKIYLAIIEEYQKILR